MATKVFCSSARKSLVGVSAVFALASLAPYASADLIVDSPNSPYTYSSGYADYGLIVVGDTGTGVLNESGGDLNSTSGGTTNTPGTAGLCLGRGAGSNGTYNMTGGGSSVSVMYVGIQGTGTFNQNGGPNGGSVSVFGNFYLASIATAAGGASSYNLGGTGGGLYVQYNSYLGINASGTQGNSAVFTITNSSAQFGGGVSFGNATLNLNGGTFRGGGATTTAATVFNFNGGAYSGSGTLQGGVTLNVRNNGGVFGGSLNLTQPLVHSTIVGDAAGDGGIKVLGQSSLTLNAASTYNGGTLVSGALNVRNAAGSATGTGAVSVLNGGSLSGGGRIGGAVYVESRGLLAPDRPAAGGGGVLTLASNLTLQYNANLQFSLGGTATANGPALLQVGGAASLGSANLVIDSSNNQLQVGDTVTLLAAAAGVTGQFISGTTVQGSTGVTYRINYNVGSVSLTVISVPEPATWTFLGAGALGLAGMGLRRKLAAGRP